MQLMLFAFFAASTCKTIPLRLTFTLRRPGRGKHETKPVDTVMSERAAPPVADLCRVLTLDGGGAKGFYTLGALKEIEAMIGRGWTRAVAILD